MKEEWKKVKLGEICKIGDGAHASLKRQNNGILYLTAKNITSLGLDLSKVEYIDEKTYEKHFSEKSTTVTCPKKGDILYSIIGSIGGCYLIKDDKEKIGISSSVAIFRPIKDVIDEKYLFYFLKSELFQQNVNAVKTGAAQGFMSLGRLSLVEISYPKSLPTQQKIASILSAYDDLIENNRKQIKLLEEAAQKLYKEWFVELHFPGWENTKIVDGIPEGWKKGHIVDIGEFKRGKTITKDQTIPGSVPVVAGGLEPAYYHNVANTESPVITVSGSGANAGFTRLYNEKVWASDCSFLDASKCENLFFIYCCLKTATATIDNLQKGAAQPHVYAKDINALEMLIPNDEVLSNFDLIVKNYFIKIKDCQVTIRKSQATRDKLLPKLMSGEIDVSEIKLPTVEE